MARKGEGRDVIVKKYEIVESRHHGGAWKVAYADFVTAMMAFFLLMWLLSATTEEQRKGLADYFSPTNLLSHAPSGSGEPFGGHTPFDKGALASDRGSVQVAVGERPAADMTADGTDPIRTEMHRAREGDGIGSGPVPDDMAADSEPDPTALGQTGTRAAKGPGGSEDVQRDGRRNPGEADLEAIRRQREKTAFELAAREIQDAVQSDPALAELGKQIAFDMTPDGLRIQIMDEVRLPMFPSGSALPNERARLLMQKIVPVLTRLNRSISIAGHTDAAPFPGQGRSNWELSADRANATRRLLTEGGFPEPLVRSVTGNAARDPLVPSDPLAAANRRIAITVLRDPARTTLHDARAVPRLTPHDAPSRATPPDAPPRDAR